ncbi:hypothetical protein AQJ91_17690 [Streptomyces dysideae]|uniref:Uncharacterized protein n=1 Tax=Streptomyces dysideae TaxID=909626 RepID=A0A101UZB9_9ACTN|nr:hypothetical protein AQJ91_17690 [Streptomyces dysideae]
MLRSRTPGLISRPGTGPAPTLLLFKLMRLLHELLERENVTDFEREVELRQVIGGLEVFEALNFS